MKETGQKVSKRTCTTLFLLPLLEGSQDVVKIDSFVNAFLGKDKHIIYAYDKLDDAGEYIESVEYNKEVEEIIGLFISGKYSKFPTTIKQKILNFWGVSKGSRLYNILYPNHYHYENFGVQVTAEIWPKPDLVKESI